MVSLVERSPLEGLCPLQVGPWRLDELRPAAITAIAPFKGRIAAVSAALQKAHGLAFPAPGRSSGDDDARLVWTGPEQAMLLGPQPGAIAGAALADQSDGWAVMRLSGEGAAEVLARLVPLDLRDGRLVPGDTARSLLFHAPSSITRSGAQAFDIMVFRSMGKTAVHEIGRAMRLLHARAGL